MGNSLAVRSRVFFIATISTLLILVLATTGVNAAAGTCTWTGGGADENFSTAGNWSGCDADGIPEDGDTLAFPTSVDSDTTDGDDRELNNDIVDLSVAGISVTGSYADEDYDYYNIIGNDLTVTGDVLGNAADSSSPKISFDVALTAGADLELAAVNSTGGLTIGSNTVTVTSSSFDGGLSGDGDLIIEEATNGGGGAGGGCSYVTASPAYPFGGDSSGYSGDVTVSSSSLGVTSRSTDLARNASSVTIGEDGILVFTLDYGVNMSFSTPLTLNGGNIWVSQVRETSDCPEPDTKTLTISGTVTGTQTTNFYLVYANVKVTGSVNGGDYLVIPDGRSVDYTLTVGSTVKKSALKTTTYTGDNSSSYPSVGENNVVIIAEGANTNSVTVYGGILKGIGTVADLFMSSGYVAPGLSPGCLSSGNVTFTGGELQIEIAGNEACDEYDQLDVTGTVDLGSESTLDVSFLDDYFPKKGDVFTIVKNDGSDAVIGTFDGLAEGDTYSNDDANFRISYKGGTGNDITLTVLNVPGAPDTGAPLLDVNTVLPIASTVALVGGLMVAKRQFATSKTK